MTADTIATTASTNERESIAADEHVELGEEPGGERDAGLRQQEHGERRRPAAGGAGPARGSRRARGAASPRRPTNVTTPKLPGDHERVGHEVEERPGDAPVAGGLDAHEDEPGVADRRVGEHALHVGLHDGEDRPDEQRGHRQRVDERPPVAGVRLERLDEHPQQPGEPGRLHARRHVRHRGAGRPLVHVGRPRVERHRRHLEPEPHEQERAARPATTRSANRDASAAVTCPPETSVTWLLARMPVRLVVPVAP